MKRIVLIYPHGANGMPLGFAYLKGNTDRNKYEISVLDCSLDDIEPGSSEFKTKLKDLNPQVVGITSWSQNFPEALKTLKAVKNINPDITTVLGGPHATVYPEHAIDNKDVDFVIRGEAEFSFQMFLDELFKTNRDFSKVDGLVYRNNEGGIVCKDASFILNLDDIKMPDYDSINLDRYFKKGYNYELYSPKKNAPIWVTRGCPYKCAFCSVPMVSGGIIRKHSVAYMINVIKFLYENKGIRGFSIVDDNFTFDKDYAKSFCREVIKMRYKDIEFNTPNGIRMQRGDLELWRLMRQAGWRCVTVAPESGSQKVLNSMRKGLDVKEVPGIIKDMKKAGLKVNCFFMVGYPGETMEDISKTAALIRKCKPHIVAITIFQPMPGTPIYDDLVAKKEIPEGYLPELFGKTSYVTPELKGFNFSRFILTHIFYNAYLCTPARVLKLVFNIARKPHKALKRLYKLCTGWVCKKE